MEEALEIFTDGACTGNPGPGGWGVVFNHSLYQNTYSGACESTTNNRMELLAVIEGLHYALPYKTLVPHIILLSDSQYVVRGATLWSLQWQRNGWRTSQRKSVENRDLWEKLLEIKQAFSALSWQWIRGHSGLKGNEEADSLARKALMTLLQKNVTSP